MTAVLEATPKKQAPPGDVVREGAVVPERAAWQVGDAVEYCGVINEEADLERRGIVKLGPSDVGDYLVEWTLPCGAEVGWHPPGELTRVCDD